jgi:polyribonucleotide nucleotidyltransferase
MDTKTYTEDFAGKKLNVEIGKLAGQANGSCRIQYGDTTILATAVIAKDKKGVDYLPLSLNYEERYYAAGKIKGSKWLKREGRPSDESILTGRLIDRTLRPRFDQRIRNDIQVVITILSFDEQNDPDIPAMFGASLALTISDIPWNGPIAGVRVGKVNGKLILNPSYNERVQSTFDMVVAGTKDKINMLETGAKVVSEKELSQAAGQGFKELQKLIALQEKIAKDVSVVKKTLDLEDHDESVVKIVRDFISPKLDLPKGGGLYTKDKKEFYKNVDETHDALIDHVKTQFAQDPDLSKKISEVEKLFEEELDHIVHKNILESGIRPDGRKMDEVRTLSAETGVLPRTHGTGLFLRGQTQALSVLTLASPGLEQWVETMETDLTKKRFMHHYVFPPFSVGETGRMGGAGRREIGHGALAERALEPIIPSKEEFPYTIRIVSEILSSNGSSSMASVCGSTLALMDGGVPIKSPAAGIAMGLMFDKSGKKYKILTDIQGPEDHYGDMDLKVAGTKDGVTGLQMDVKIDGITEKILSEALEQAKKARLEILEVLNKTISTPRKELSKHAPRIKIIKINPEKIGALIGPGGKVINEIIEKTKTTIDIEDDGSVFVTADNPEGMEKALKLIEEITYEIKPGDEFDGTVVRLMDFGAFVSVGGGKDGLVHVSQIAKERINRPSDVLKIGQKVHVRVREIDDRGRINLTMKDAGDQK